MGAAGFCLRGFTQAYQAFEWNELLHSSACSTQHSLLLNVELQPVFAGGLGCCMAAGVAGDGVLNDCCCLCLLLGVLPALVCRPLQVASWTRPWALSHSGSCWGEWCRPAAAAAASATATWGGGTLILLLIVKGWSSV